MPLKHVYKFVSIAAFMITLLGLIAQAHALSVEQIRFGTHTDKTRLVVDLSEETDFRIFVLADPYRLVIDLPAFKWKAGKIGATPKAAIKAVRHGMLEPGYARIVLDMALPVIVREAFIMRRGAGLPDRLVIDFSPAEKAEFEREKRTIHGTLRFHEQNAPVQDVSANTYEPDERTAGYAPAPVPSLKPDTKKPLVVIDPGHGGVDPGAVGKNGVYEKKVTLALAKELKRQLEETGQYRVLLTRENDIFIKLSDRVKFARDNNADLFVSLHADSIDKPHVRGASIYTLSDTASDAQTEKLAARENKADLIAGLDLSVEDQDVANILVDLAMRDTMNQSRFFATKLVSTIGASNLNLLDSPHRYAGFAVLKAPDIPSVLIEAGFMSNAQEAGLLNNHDYRSQVAKAIRSGIDAYFDQVRKNQRI